MAQELGADEAIDYTKQQFDEALRASPVDAVIDMMGGALPAMLPCRGVDEWGAGVAVQTDACKQGMWRHAASGSSSAGGTTSASPTRSSPLWACSPGRV